MHYNTLFLCFIFFVVCCCYARLARSHVLNNTISREGTSVFASNYPIEGHLGKSEYSLDVVGRTDLGQTRRSTFLIYYLQLQCFHLHNSIWYEILFG